MPVINQLERAITLPVVKQPKSHMTFWFVLSLVVSLTYSWVVVQHAFSNPYVTQDDARQHVFWMRRFLDPTLFPNDFLTDYFQSVAPVGYSSVYRFFTLFGLDPMVTNRLLPMVLALIATAYGFWVALQFLPIPLMGFLSCVLMNQYFWMHDDIASGTARGFMFPLMLAFLYYVLRRDEDNFVWRSLIPCLVVIVLEGLFYPQYVFVFAGILLLLPIQLRAGRLQLSQDQRDYWMAGAGLAAAFLIMLPLALRDHPFGPVMTGAEARKLWEFRPTGRNAFFYDHKPIFFWFSARRSGLLATIYPPLKLFGFLFPFLFAFPQRFPLIRKVTPKTTILLRWLLAALTLFFVAHAVLFKLYLPSRYSSYSLHLILVFTASMTLLILLDAGLGLLRQVSDRPPAVKTPISIGVILPTLLVLYTLVAYPLISDPLPHTEYRVAQYPEIYRVLAAQPKDTLVASLLEEADFIPTFARRSVYVSRELALPYHVGYRDRFRQRAEALIRAHYTPELAALQNFIRETGVDFWLVAPGQFNDHSVQHEWFQQYPAAIADARRFLRRGVPALAKQMDRCTVLTEKPTPLDETTAPQLGVWKGSWIRHDPIQLVSSACLLQAQP